LQYELKNKTTMEKRSLFFLVLLGLIANTYGQNTQTFVEVKGQIVDAESGESVKANIFYESLPYGNKVGVFNDTVFSFKMEEGVSYSILVKADGYIAGKKTFSPDMVVDGFIYDTIYLSPTLSGKLIRLESLIFARGNDHIPASAHEELDQYVELMKENPNMLIKLEGHTDYRGDAKKNMELSESRVKVTKDYFVNKGIDKKRIETVAFGGTQPVKRSNDPESIKLNRRVELRILQY